MTALLVILGFWVVCLIAVAAMLIAARNQVVHSHDEGMPCTVRCRVPVRRSLFR